MRSSVCIGIAVISAGIWSCSGSVREKGDRDRSGLTNPNVVVLADSLTGTISEVMYQKRTHYEIRTKTAVYLYDIRGGGFSSIRDSDGVEWIGFKPGDGEVPESAAADFRGLPNLVFRGADNGAGHPGFDKCRSDAIGPDRIRTVSVSGLWEWTWTFRDSTAHLEVTRTDTSRCYWFLYEGIPGGTFNPGEQYWGNNRDGIRMDAPPIGSDATAEGTWRWACFGHENQQRSFFAVQLTEDKLADTFSYMGASSKGIESEDGMVVFGFGRKGAAPLLNGPNRFIIGFYDHADPDPLHENLARYIKTVTAPCKN